MIKESLNGQWKLYYIDQTYQDIQTPDELNKNTAHIPCTVPGNVELDLIENGLLPKDIYFGSNITKCQEFEKYQWWYEREFELTDSQLAGDMYLKFDGVDCIAQYFLNGKKIGESSNMLTEHEFCINSAKKKKNILQIKLNSVLMQENRESFSLISLFANCYKRQNSVEVRKAPHTYGWDIMPRAVSAGLWRSVWLVEKERVEIKQFAYVPYNMKKSSIDVAFCYEVSCPEYMLNRSSITISGKCKEQVFIIKDILRCHAGKICTTIKKPFLWMPKGYGDANLYDVNIKIEYCDEEVLSHSEKIGLKTVEVRNSEVTNGTDGRFAFIINGVEIFCKGTNWVPLDAFHSRDVQRLPKALQLLDDIGCNMVRMWGGNIYEDDCFFDFCDSHGIMVWQDFSMACNAYPHTDQFAKEIKKEAEFIIKKLRNHPSLTIWSGDNECDVMVFENSGANPNNNIVTRSILKDMVFCHDFSKPYLPSSPFISDKAFSLRRTDIISENHIWGPRDYYKSRFYTECKAHFVSEYGYYGAPAVSSMEKFFEKDDMPPCAITENKILHSSDFCGNDERVKTVLNQVIQLFGEIPKSTENFVLASQISQAEALKFFIEKMRIGRPAKTGIIWWNLTDGWPQISDAVTDYYFEKKLAYNVIKNVQQPFCIMIDEIENWNLKVVGGNDTLFDVCGYVKVKDFDTGDICFETNFSVSRNTSELIGEFPMMYSSEKFLIIEWTIDNNEYKNYYLCGQTPHSFEKCKKWFEFVKKL